MTFEQTNDSSTLRKGGRVVLISPYGIENRGVRYISAVLRSNGFDPHLILFKRWINNSIKEPTSREVEILCETIKEIDPLLVAMGFGAPYLKIAKYITGEIKKHSGAFSLWGGVYPTVCPEECIDHADAVCVGEGEFPTLDLCNALAKGEDPGKIANLWVNTNGEVTKNNPRSLIENLNELPFPDYMNSSTLFIEDDKALKTDPIGDTAEYRIYPTRGCPYSCSYCHNSVLRRILKNKGKYYRIRDVRNIINELLEAKKILPRIRRIKFDGDVFAFPKSWLDDFCREYTEKIALPFEILTYPGELNEGDLRGLKKAGLIKMQTGIQSGSDEEVKTAYNRRSTVDVIRELTDMAHRVGIQIVYDIIFDNPTADRASKRAVVDLLLEIAHPFRIYIYSLTVFPKTQLADNLLKAGIITTDDIEGKATKSFRQFRLSFDYPRSKEDVFWISLTILTSKSFMPRSLIRRLMKSEWLMEHPWPLRLLAQGSDLIKDAFIASNMLIHGELTLFKIRQYGSFKKLISQ